MISRSMGLDCMGATSRSVDIDMIDTNEPAVESLPKAEPHRRSGQVDQRATVVAGLDAADHEKSLLRQMVVFALGQLLEGLDRLVDRGVLAGDTGELFGYEERLRQEPLDLAGPAHDDLVLLRELVDPEDGDDVLKVL